MKLRAILLVSGVGGVFLACTQRCHETAFEQTVSGFNMLAGGEIRLEETNRKVRRRGSLIVVRDGGRERRVDDGETGNDRAGLQRALVMAVLQHGAVGNLGAAAGDCGDDADRHGVVDLRLAGEQVPHVAVIAQAGAHGLCSVEGAGAACRDDEIHMLVTGLFDECAHEVDAGIGHDVSCFDERGVWVDALGGGFHGGLDS